MLSLDLGEARAFLSILGYDKKDVSLRFFVDDKNKSSDIGRTFHGNFEDAVKLIEQYQNEGMGVYFNVNPTDGEGLNAENVTSFDWLVADLDNQALPETLPLTPSVITYRDATHTHLYIPVKNVLTIQQYNGLQKRLAFYLQSDEAVVDPTRVLRLPGTLHLKDPSNPRQYRILNDYGLTERYTPEQIEAALPLSAELETKLATWVSNREAYENGTGFNDNPLYIEQFRHFAANIGTPAGHSSLHRGHQAIQVSLFARDRGVRLETCQQIMWDVYNPRCNPPWDNQRKLFDHIKNGYRYANNAVGCKTVGAEFTELGEVPEPVDGWEANRKLRHGKDTVEYTQTIENDSGIIRRDMVGSESITSKTSVADLARYFMGMEYSDGGLLNYQETTFAYNGKYWEKVDDELLSKQIDHFYDNLRFDHAKITKILKTVKVKATRLKGEVEKGEWLDGREGQFIGMQNGILEIGRTPAETVLHPFSRDFFDTSILTFPYNPNAVCPEHIAFMQSQCPGDPQFIRQMKQVYGATMMTNHVLQMIALFIGKTRSGKGVHEKLIRLMLGPDSVCSPNLENIGDGPQLEKLSTCRLGIIPESNNLASNVRGKVQDMLKSLSGGDSVTIDRKYKSAVTIDKFPMLMMVANELPNFMDVSGAFANRIWPVQFNVSFYGREDTTLLDRLSTPEAMAGIFNWALEGAREIMNADMKVYMSDANRAFVDELRYDTDPLSGFVNEYCLLGPDYSETVDNLFIYYTRHCMGHGVKVPATQVGFTKKLSASYLPIHKEREGGKHRRYVFRGIKIDPAVANKLNPTQSSPDNVVPMQKKTP